MSTDRYPYVMAEDLIQLTLGAYTIRIDKSKFDIKQKDNFIAVTAKDNPDLKATISIEKVFYFFFTHSSKNSWVSYFITIQM